MPPLVYSLQSASFGSVKARNKQGQSHRFHFLFFLRPSLISSVPQIYNSNFSEPFQKSILAIKTKSDI